MSTIVDLTHTTLTEWSSVIIGCATLISAIGSAFAAISSARNASKIDKNTEKIKEVHDATNGMKAELVKTTGDLMYAKGRAQGEDFPRLRLPRKPPALKLALKKKHKAK